jgi:hypothetical protein
VVGVPGPSAAGLVGRAARKASAKGNVIIVTFVISGSRGRDGVPEGTERAGERALIEERIDKNVSGAVRHSVRAAEDLYLAIWGCSCFRVSHIASYLPLEGPKPITYMQGRDNTHQPSLRKAERQEHLAPDTPARATGNSSSRKKPRHRTTSRHLTAKQTGLKATHRPTETRSLADVRPLCPLTWDQVERSTASNQVRMPRAPFAGQADRRNSQAGDGALPCDFEACPACLTTQLPRFTCSQ